MQDIENTPVAVVIAIEDGLLMGYTFDLSPAGIKLLKAQTGFKDEVWVKMRGVQPFGFKVMSLKTLLGQKLKSQAKSVYNE